MAYWFVHPPSYSTAVYGMTAVILGQECQLTLNGEDHALADVRSHSVGGLAEVKTPVFFQDVSYEKGAITHELDAASQRNRVVLLGIPDAGWTQRRQ